MRNFHEDDAGIYDLTGVVSITPAVDRDKNNHETGRRAILHLVGGGLLHTNTDYKTLVEKWKGGAPPAKEEPTPAPPAS